MILYLVRHGKSLANTAKLVTGTPSDTLSDIGIKQAQELSSWLKSTQIKPTRFVTSQWKRAQQTAHILMPDADWQTDARVGETDCGSVADWPQEKFDAAYPAFFDRNDNKFPDGESHKDLYERVTGWLKDVLQKGKDEQIMMVGHSGPISYLIQYALGLGWEHFPAFPPVHASLSIIECPKNGRAKLAGFSLIPAERVGAPR